MAEPRKDKKLDIRRLLEDLAEDEEFSDEERELEREKVLETEYKAWSSRLTKSKA